MEFKLILSENYKQDFFDKVTFGRCYIVWMPLPITS
jgi:hypothetical protein